MKIKRSQDLVPTLRGAAFRRVSCDGRSWFLREIPTLRSLARKKGRSRALAQAR